MKRRIVPPQSPKDENGAYIKQVPKPSLGPFRVDKFLFDKQRVFVESPHPFKIAVCSRRSGKTVACAADLVNTAIHHPEVVCLYITLSRNNAKKIIWRDIQRINEDYKLGGEEDLTELSMTFPNKSIIYLSGAKDEAEIEKFRGMAFKKVYIDECQSFREYIRELIDDVISPALMDHAGTLCLIGTPGPIPAGYFAEVAGAVPDKIASSASWQQFGWTFFDNPWIERKSGMTHQQALDRELKRRGVTVTDPSVRREFFGEWTEDTESLWIQYNRDKNDYDTLPPHLKYDYILGIDLGFNDADALAVIAWSEATATTYLVEELVVPQQGLTELVGQIQDLQKRYDFSKMVIDEGGLGKKLAEEMRRRHGIPVQAADKARKQENVSFLNDALRTGRFKAHASSRFAQDSKLVEIDWNKSTPDRIRLSDQYHSDIIDAVLYAFKESNAFTYEAPKPKPAYGSKEWAEAETHQMWEDAVDFHEKQAQFEKYRQDMGED